MLLHRQIPARRRTSCLPSARACQGDNRQNEVRFQIPRAWMGCLSFSWFRGPLCVNLLVRMPSVRFHPLNRDPLHLIKRYLVAGAIIELGGARTLVRGHRLRVLQRSTGFQIGGDARGAEGMAADPGARAELGGAALDRGPANHSKISKPWLPATAPKTVTERNARRNRCSLSMSLNVASGSTFARACNHLSRTSGLTPATHTELNDPPGCGPNLGCGIYR